MLCLVCLLKYEYREVKYDQSMLEELLSSNSEIGRTLPSGTSTMFKAIIEVLAELLVFSLLSGLLRGSLAAARYSTPGRLNRAIGKGRRLFLLVDNVGDKLRRERASCALGLRFV